MSFFKRGAEGAKANAQFEAAAKARAEQLKNTPREFYLKLGQKARIMFLDDPDFFFKRHTTKVNGKFDSVTCMEEENDCPACMSGNIPAMVIACTILTMDGYKHTNGKEYKYQKQLLVVRGDAKTHLLDMLKKRKSLKNCIVEVSRGTQQKSPSIGAYDFEGKLPKEKFDKLIQILPKFIKSNTEQDIPVSKYLAPYDYEKVFSPLPKEQLAKMFGMANVESYGASDDFSCTDDLDTSTTDIDDLDTEISADLDIDADLDSDLDSTPELDTSDVEVPFDDAVLKKDTSEYEDLDDDELLEKMVELGCRKLVAQKMKRPARLEWIADTIAEMKEEVGDPDGDGLEERTEKELSKILKEEFSIPSKKILQMEKEDMIEAIREMRAGE